MGLRILAGDGEPETCTLHMSLVAGASLVKRLENALALVGIDAWPVVSDFERDLGAVARDADQDLAVGRRVLHCVRQQVVHQDTELSLVALQNRWCDQAVDRQSLCGSHQALPIEGAAYHFVQRHLLAPRAFDSRYVSASELQQVLDQALQLHAAVAQDMCDLP